MGFLGSGGLPVAQPQPLYEPFYMKPNVLAGFIREISFLNIHLGPPLDKSIIFDRFYKAFHPVPLLGKTSLFSTGFIRGFHFLGICSASLVDGTHHFQYVLYGV